ncbi:STAS domain-containing protein [Couchioplanes caeruleus]|uniref:STAS domain-containing protein n=1 Tax=Couchioplanes caeruleus TaxID=56438 RepID=UPI0014751350|nr:STAS domain-containing protein [Couchioplanes caeruleus]
MTITAVEPCRAGVILATVSGPVDLLTVDRFRTQVEALLPDGGVRVLEGLLELDLSQVSFCDVAGLRALLAVRDTATRAGYRMMITNADGYTEALIAVFRLSELLGFQPADKE